MPPKRYAEPDSMHRFRVQTPFGRGVVAKTRKADGVSEIRLSTSGVLYSTAEFPSVPAVVGDLVLTIYGRGRVLQVRDDRVHVVELSSWRLAGRSRVACFVSADALRVIEPLRVYHMTSHEKVDYANELKEKATAEFGAKNYNAALELYSKAVEAVRFVQHNSGASNELRADLLVVIIACSNNAATCCMLLEMPGRATKFATNAIMLIEALESKAKSDGGSQIKRILNKEGKPDAMLFGTWKVKSLKVLATSSSEKDDEAAVKHIKSAFEVIAAHKESDDAKLNSQLVAQEKQLRKLYVACKERIKATKKKEKERAKAMFGGGSAKKTKTSPKSVAAEMNGSNHSNQNNGSSNQTKSISFDGDATNSTSNDVPQQEERARRRVSFTDGSRPGDDEYDDDDDEEGPSFFEEHKEALWLVSGVVGASLLVGYFWKRK